MVTTVAPTIPVLAASNMPTTMTEMPRSLARFPNSDAIVASNCSATRDFSSTRPMNHEQRYGDQDAHDAGEPIRQGLEKSGIERGKADAAGGKNQGRTGERERHRITGDQHYAGHREHLQGQQLGHRPTLASSFAAASRMIARSALAAPWSRTVTAIAGIRAFIR